MSKPTVVVLSSHTLFTEGITSRLQAHDEALHLCVVDSRSSNALDEILALAPQAVIVDTSDPEASLNCPINQLLAKIPELKIIRLDPELSGFQVVKSARHTASEVDDLVEAILGGVYRVVELCSSAFNSIDRELNLTV